MKNICIILFSMFLSQISATQIPKLCINCKFYKNLLFSDSRFGQCTMFPIKRDNDYFLVNGYTKKNKIEYNYCSISRKYEDMCGNEAIFYKNKYKNF